MEHILRIQRLKGAVEKENLLDFSSNEMSECWRAFCGAPWRVLLVGQYNAGKTTLLNALLGERRFAEGPVPTTQEFQETEVAKGLVVVDSPGMEAPDSRVEDRLKVESRKADQAVVVLQSGDLEGETVYKQLCGFVFKRPVILVVNVKDDLSENDKSRVLEKVRARMESCCPHVKFLDPFCVNAASARQAVVEGKANLLARSGIEPLRQALLKAHQEFVRERDVRLLRAMAMGLRERAQDEAKALAAMAEARVLLRLLHGGLSLAVEEGARLSTSVQSIADTIRSPRLAEVRATGMETGQWTYIDWLAHGVGSYQAIIDGAEISWGEDGGVAALVGIEMRGGSITRKGSDLYLLSCRLERCYLDASNRADLWAAGCDFKGFDKLSHRSAISVRDRSRAVVVDCVFDPAGQIFSADASSDVRLRGCCRLGWTRKGHHATKALGTWQKRLRGIFVLPWQPDWIAPFRGLLLVRKESRLWLVEPKSGRLLDVFACRIGAELPSVPDEVVTDECRNLIVLRKGEDLAFLCVEGSRFASPSGVWPGFQTITLAIKMSRIVLATDGKHAWGVARGKAVLYDLEKAILMGEQPGNVLHPVHNVDPLEGDSLRSQNPVQDRLIEVLSDLVKNIFMIKQPGDVIQPLHYFDPLAGYVFCSLTPIQGGGVLALASAAGADKSRWKCEILNLDGKRFEKGGGGDGDGSRLCSNATGDRIVVCLTNPKVAFIGDVKVPWQDKPVAIKHGWFLDDEWFGFIPEGYGNILLLRCSTGEVACYPTNLYSIGLVAASGKHLAVADGQTVALFEMIRGKSG